MAERARLSKGPLTRGGQQGRTKFRHTYPAAGGEILQRCPEKRKGSERKNSEISRPRGRTPEARGAKLGSYRTKDTPIAFRVETGRFE